MSVWDNCPCRLSWVREWQSHDRRIYVGDESDGALCRAKNTPPNFSVGCVYDTNDILSFSRLSSRGLSYGSRHVLPYR